MLYLVDSLAPHVPTRMTLEVHEKLETTITDIGGDLALLGAFFAKRLETELSDRIDTEVWIRDAAVMSSIRLIVEAAKVAYPGGQAEQIAQLELDHLVHETLRRHNDWWLTDGDGKPSVFSRSLVK